MSIHEHTTKLQIHLPLSLVYWYDGMYSGKEHVGMTINLKVKKFLIDAFMAKSNPKRQLQAAGKLVKCASGYLELDSLSYEEFISARNELINAIIEYRNSSLE